MAAPASSPRALIILCTCIHRGACTCTRICLSTVVCNDVSLHTLENKVHTHTHTHSPFPNLTQKQTTHTTTSTWPSQLFISMYIHRSLITMAPNCYRYGKTAQEQQWLKPSPRKGSEKVLGFDLGLCLGSLVGRPEVLGLDLAVIQPPDPKGITA